MNRALSSSFVKFVSIAMLSLSSLATAAEGNAPADLAKGSTLYSSGDASRGITACVACHGAAGNSTISVNPKLAGQHEAYLQKQLHDFRGPNRNNAVMTMIAKALSEEDIRNISAYLAEQKPAPGAAKNKDTVEWGKQIFRGGIAEKNVPACAGCHSPNGAGIPAQYPRLAGQHQDYSVAQLNNFSSGARSNSVQMSTISQRMSEAEMKAVSDYMAGLK